MGMEWFEDAILHLPGSGDALFHSLWGQRHMRYTTLAQEGEVTNEYSARLVCAALRKAQPLLMVFPDERPDRPPSHLRRLFCAIGGTAVPWRRKRIGQSSTSAPEWGFGINSQTSSSQIPASISPRSFTNTTYPHIHAWLVGRGGSHPPRLMI